MQQIITHKWQSPAGLLIIGSIGHRLCLCDWAHQKHRAATDRRLKRWLNADFTDGTSSVIETAISQLEEYFAGQRQTFDMPLALAGTDFQMKVWAGLMGIPFGRTVSYLDIARGIGNPAAVRAVANAIGSNPISIIVPCHRVLGSDKSLTGYSGGLAAKRILLEIECPYANIFYQNHPQIKNYS